MARTCLPMTPVVAAPGARFGTRRLGTGVQVHFIEQGDPDAEVFVFLHGYTDSWFSYSRLLPLLPPERYHAYAVDQRGHGHSERPTEGYTLDAFAADVVAFLDAVGARRVTLVGHSGGTMIARHVAVHYPSRVERVVLLGALPVAPLNAATRELQAAVRVLPDAVPRDFVREFQASTLHAPVPEWFFERVVAEGMKRPGWVWRRALDGLLAADDGAQLSQIAAPTLLLWGEQDAMFSRHEQEELAATIPGAGLLVYPETGHCPQWERPEWVAADLCAFLDAPLPSPS